MQSVLDNDLCAIGALRCQGKIEWIHVRHDCHRSRVPVLAIGAQATFPKQQVISLCGDAAGCACGRADEVLDLAVTNLWR